MKRTLFVALVLAVVASFVMGAVAFADMAGTVTIRDDKATGDKVVVDFTGITAPAAGKIYVGWLVSDDGKTMVNIGALTVKADGSVSASYTSPKGENISGLYSKFVVTTEAAADLAATAPKGAVTIQADGAPAQSLMHVRHLDYQWDVAPNKTGLATGTLTQARLLAQHAKLMQDQLTAGNLAGVKQHAEHVVNIIEGSKGQNFGDLDKNGAAQNPGDGFGLFEYAKGAAQHGTFAASTPDASTYVKHHAPHVADTAANVIDWATQARDAALNVLKAADIAGATPLVATVVTNANLALDGKSTKPEKGEGGATTTYEHAQNMAAFNVTAMTMAPTAATTAAPAPAPAAAALPKAGDSMPLGLLALAGLFLMTSGAFLRRWSTVRTRK